jgi:antitoxin (DNA-binding transcriptional repressor) of toxin-antitoxin stability system
MYVANIREAKTHLCRLIDGALAGEEIVIARGQPVVRTIPYQEEQPPNRTPGIWKGKVEMSPDFDDVPESIAGAFNRSRATL